MNGRVPVYMFVMSIIQLLNIRCTMSGVFFSKMYLASVHVDYFYYCSVVLLCHVSFLMQNPQKDTELLFLFSVFCLWSVPFVHTDVNLSEIHPN